SVENTNLQWTVDVKINRDPVPWDFVFVTLATMKHPNQDEERSFQCLYPKSDQDSGHISKKKKLLELSDENNDTVNCCLGKWSKNASKLELNTFANASRKLTVQTAKTRKNSGKRFLTCSKCKVYDFLDDDLPSEYYKELLYGMFQNKKQSKKHMDYEQVINVLAMEKSMCEEELRATKIKA
ncbi:hypothetical protein Tco_1231495, partial [Tanacetum coccineum]